MLQALGLKSGGTLRQRAERLFLTKNTPLDKLDRKHFARGAAPAAALEPQRAAAAQQASKAAALAETKVGTAAWASSGASSACWAVSMPMPSVVGRGILLVRCLQLVWRRGDQRTRTTGCEGCCPQGRVLAGFRCCTLPEDPDGRLKQGCTRAQPLRSCQEAPPLCSLHCLGGSSATAVSAAMCPTPACCHDLPQGSACGAEAQLWACK